jgi:hypothetical protein
LAFGSSHVLRMAAEMTGVGRRWRRIVRLSADPPVAHSGQQHFDGQIPVALAECRRLVAREEGIRPVDVVMVR